LVENTISQSAQFNARVMDRCDGFESQDERTGGSRAGITESGGDSRISATAPISPSIDRHVEIPGLVAVPGHFHFKAVFHCVHDRSELVIGWEKGPELGTCPERFKRAQRLSSLHDE
jgi:hypothetical protein